jgi:Flp pilus assembly protein TadD
VGLWLGICLGVLALAAEPEPLAPAPSTLIEAVGQVSWMPTEGAPWQPATVGALLHPGCRLRTGPASRAAVQFSDRSLLRLDAETTLEILPPTGTEPRRFGLPRGRLFFFHRERPATTEFETPLTSGAIRGTEFVLESTPAPPTTRLALLDGRVHLSARTGAIELESGEEVLVEPGQPPRKSALISTRRDIQWALYYPAVLAPEDLAWEASDLAVLREALDAYRAGDPPGAHALMQPIPPGGPARELFRAAVAVAAGQIQTAETTLQHTPPETAAARALQELLDVVRRPFATAPPPAARPPRTASEWLARSYTAQARLALEDALTAARQAALLAPNLGYAHARVAELEWMLEHRREARAALNRALALAPRLAPAHALEGFLRLEEHRVREALAAFEAALATDTALGSAWLGRGLALWRLGQREAARRSLQTATALEPQRALYRAYLGKLWSQRGEFRLAEKELDLARRLDPNDPTPWLYSALHHHQTFRPNAAVRDLEESAARNDHRQLFRARAALDRDRAVRSAHQAALYQEAGLPEAAWRAAARAAWEDYANAAAHLMLADSFRALEDPNRLDLRYETARQSELLLANLLAPAGAGNLSQGLAQQEFLQFLEPRPFGLGSVSEYRTRGDWRHRAAVFGTLDGFSYAVDFAYDRLNGEAPNAWRERTDASTQIKQRVTADDELYLQVAFSEGRAGDVARYDDPARANPTLHVTETQSPNLWAGWHRSWSASSHTLALFSRLDDALELANEQQQVLFLRRRGDEIVQVSTDEPGFARRQHSDFTLYSGELQQLWQGAPLSGVVGGRLQAGEVATAATLERALTGVVSDQRLDADLARATAYAYGQWRVADPLHVMAGVSYDRVTFPRNTDLVPLSPGETTRDLWAPKAGLVWTPWRDGVFRAAYTRSLGGLFFDQSVRLEPTQVVGFVQAWRSLLPESVVGLVPGAEFEVAGLALDQSWRHRTWLGLSAEWRRSEGERVTGALTHSGFLPVPDTATSTRQSLDLAEASLGAYAVQLLGDGLALGARYRLTRDTLTSRFPDLPRTALHLDTLEQDVAAELHEVALSLNYQHPAGFFAGWESVWRYQDSAGYVPEPAEADFWQHHVRAGWRFPRRRAELSLALLNLTGRDYRLNPLNPWTGIPRERTLAVSLRLNF